VKKQLTIEIDVPDAPELKPPRPRIMPLAKYAKDSGIELKPLMAAAKAKKFKTCQPGKRLCAVVEDMERWIESCPPKPPSKKPKKAPDTGVAEVADEDAEFEAALMRRAS
jgi:hypothetical protein